MGWSSRPDCSVDDSVTGANESVQRVSYGSTFFHIAGVRTRNMTFCLCRAFSLTGFDKQWHENVYVYQLIERPRTGDLVAPIQRPTDRSFGFVRRLVAGS